MAKQAHDIGYQKRLKNQLEKERLKALTAQHRTGAKK